MLIDLPETPLQQFFPSIPEMVQAENVYHVCQTSNKCIGIDEKNPDLERSQLGPCVDHHCIGAWQDITSPWDAAGISDNSSVQSLSHVRLCDPMDCCTPGLHVHQQLPEFTQTHVYWVRDAIQPSHPLWQSPDCPFTVCWPSRVHWNVNDTLGIGQELRWGGRDGQDLDWLALEFEMEPLVIQTVKNPPAMQVDPGSIPQSGRCPREGNGHPLQYPCLENLMDRGAWWAIVCEVAKSLTQLSN